MLSAAYSKISSDTLVSNVPTLLCGIWLNASVDGGDVTIYDGQDALSGQSLGQLTGLANDPNPHMFPIPVLLNNGLYVDVGSNVTSVTLFYVPLRGNSPLKAYSDSTIFTIDE